MVWDMTHAPQNETHADRTASRETDDVTVLGQLPEYREILSFLAQNPPSREAERNVHASLLELVATSMRDHMNGREPSRQSHSDAVTTEPRAATGT